MIRGEMVFAFAVMSAAVLWAAGMGRGDSPNAGGIQIAADKTEVGEGQNVIINAKVEGATAASHSSILQAQVDGKDWGASYPILPTGVAQLVLPLPETGLRTITVTDGKSLSNSVTVQVDPRHFDIIDDPHHLVIMEYETWFGPGYAQWGSEEATPLLGHYSSLDSRVLRQQALWFNDMGFNAVELDWTNNLNVPFPGPAAKECIAATDQLLQVYSTMTQHPKVMFLMGPENNSWNSIKDVYAGPRFQEQMNYIYDHYINNPKYRDMMVTYEGKPLVLRYLNGPNPGPPPDAGDPRFTTRYVSAWLQVEHAEKYGVWSWYDQVATPTNHHGKVEALTVTDGYPSETNAVSPTGDNSWEMQSAGGKNLGETYRTQWEVAMQAKPQFLFVNQWNEFVPPDQYNVNLSNDMEPTLLTEKGDARASGWGFTYLDLTREEIAAYHRKIEEMR